MQAQPQVQTVGGQFFEIVSTGPQIIRAVPPPLGVSPVQSKSRRISIRL